MHQGIFNNALILSALGETLKGPFRGIVHHPVGDGDPVAEDEEAGVSDGKVHGQW